MDINLSENHKRAYKIILISAVLFALYFFRTPIIEGLIRFYNLLSDRDKTKLFVTSFGPYAPLVFMAIQILQVLIAPIPGEVTSFIGGYLFGAKSGFIYSSLALSIGSMINFGIGRFLGKRYIRKFIPSDKLERFDKIIRQQGVIIILLFFIFPGFPKDYLCLFLGVTALPFQVFVIMATIGRMPGTLMLSLQGEFLYGEMYGFFIIAVSCFVVLGVLAYVFRETIYRWMNRFK